MIKLVEKKILGIVVVFVSVFFLSGIPQAEALGCASLDIFLEGPYQSTLQGIIGFDNKTIDSRVRPVYVVEPGSSVNMTFDVVFHFADQESLVILDFVGYPEELSNVSWFSISYSSNPVFFKRFQERDNVTMSFDISDDVPNGDYGIRFNTRIPGGGDCIFGSNIFILRVINSDKTTTSTVFSSVIEKVGHSYAVQVTSSISSESRKFVTIDKNDTRFKEIIQYLNNSKVNAVTLKTGVVTRGNLTTTTSVTVLYSLGNYLTFMLWNGSTVHFTYEHENIWFETDQAIYQMSFDPAFKVFLNTIITTTSETITTDETNIHVYTWAVGATVTTIVLAVILVLKRKVN